MVQAPPGRSRQPFPQGDEEHGAKEQRQKDNKRFILRDFRPGAGFLGISQPNVFLLISAPDIVAGKASVITAECSDHHIRLHRGVSLHVSGSVGFDFLQDGLTRVCRRSLGFKLARQDQYRKQCDRG